MLAAGQFRRALLVGLFAFSPFLQSGAVHATASENPAELLRKADDIKTSDNAEFKRILDRVGAQPAGLSPAQLVYLRYLKAWQTAYDSNYESAISQLNGIIDGTRDPVFRFRAGMTDVEVLAIASRYEEAYARLSQILELLPTVTDHKARQQGLNAAAGLYSQAGQYDLALKYADELLAEEPQGTGVCTSSYRRLYALRKSGKLKSAGKEFKDAIDACESVNEVVWANFVRVEAAKLDLEQGDNQEAIRQLKDRYDEIQNTRYAELTADTDAIIAKAYLNAGDAAMARQYALSAVEKNIRGQITEALVGAEYVLYEVAKSQGDTTAALDWHEKYAAADKGYLNDISAHALAYQMVKQQVQEKKQQVDALNKQNQVLQLRQQVDAKTNEAGKLLILLLATVLGSIGMYAYRTKRSEVKFMKLARRDGLTDIFNRQYFVEASGHELLYCQKSIRDVSIIVIDLDHFKLINDTHGHAAGDFALKRAVAMCQAHLRSVDVFGRLGGEEFGILMPDCVPERAADQAEKMRAAIGALAESAEGPEFPVRASFGVSAARWSGYDLRQLLAHADSALYQAKREGRDRVVVYAGAVIASNGLPPGLPDRRRTLSYSEREDARR